MTTSTVGRRVRLDRSITPISLVFFFFNDTATTEIYTLSLHDALPIYAGAVDPVLAPHVVDAVVVDRPVVGRVLHRSEEHTSELQSPCNLVCRLLLDKNTICLLLISTSPTAIVQQSKRAALTRPQTKEA